MSIYYLPKDGVCGDFIPFYDQKRKVFELYYLHDYRCQFGHGEGTDWRRISTTDMKTFCEEGEIIPRSDPEGRDLFCYTGCVVEHENVKHIFYTGHNYHIMQKGGRKESVMHATCEEDGTWKKHPELTFYAPDGLDIELNDWRDPFVFFNPDENRWWMLLCTRKKTGPDRLRGAIGLLKSDDLDRWEYTGSFWNPSNCWCPECPELFHWGNYWYLIFSTFTEAEGFRTYYRMADKPQGPWRVPSYNTFDARAFYAGKTACDGEHRYIFGWNPTKEGDKDSGVWQWGGTLVAHELLQTENGELRVKMPDAVPSGYDAGYCPGFEPMLQSVEQREDELVVSAESGFALAKGDEIPEKCMITMQICLSDQAQDAGVWLHADDNGDEGYYLRLEARHNKLAFDRVYRFCDHNELERHAEITTGTWHDLTVLLDGTEMTAYLDGAVALSARMYDFRHNRLFAFASDGSARFRGIRVHLPVEEV